MVWRPRWVGTRHWTEVRWYYSVCRPGPIRPASQRDGESVCHQSRRTGRRAWRRRWLPHMLPDHPERSARPGSGGVKSLRLRVGTGAGHNVCSGVIGALSCPPSFAAWRCRRDAAWRRGDAPVRRPENGHQSRRRTAEGDTGRRHPRAALAARLGLPLDGPECASLSGNSRRCAASGKTGLIVRRRRLSDRLTVRPPVSGRIERIARRLPEYSYVLGLHLSYGSLCGSGRTYDQCLICSSIHRAVSAKPSQQRSQTAITLEHTTSGSA
jgi:hypothetical protein